MIFKRLVFLFILFSFLYKKGIAQTTPPIIWQNTIGGNKNDDLIMLNNASDGNFILGGSSESDSTFDKTINTYGDLDYWIMKVDQNGQIIWQFDFGGQNFDALYTIKQTNDAGYIIGGFSTSGISGIKTDSCRGQADYWVLKLDSIGNIEWQKTIGGTGDDELNDICQTNDGGFLIGGFSDSPISFEKSDSSKGYYDYWILKLDSLGNIQWQKTIGGNNIDWLYTVVKTKDGGFALCGDSYSDASGDKTESSRGVNDYWIIKLDSGGTIEWQKTYGGNDWDSHPTIKETQDNGFIIGGESYSGLSGDKTDINRGVGDYWIFKTDSVGNIQWQKTIGGSGGDFLTSIALTWDGGYLLCGSSESDSSFEKSENNRGPMGTGDYWILKIDSLGNIEWQKTIGGNENDGLSSVGNTIDGGYILGGSSASSVSFEKTENCLGQLDYWIIKLAGPVGIEEPDYADKGIHIFPNPAYNNLTISTSVKNIIINQLTISNIFDQKIKSYRDINTNSYLVNLFGLPSGIYALAIETNEGLVIKKFIKQ